MDAVFKKLNYRGQERVHIFNHPGSFETNLGSLEGEAEIKTSARKNDTIEFAMLFATKQAEIDKAVPKFAPKLEGDAVLWICYPKGTSKNYSCDFNRDTGFEILGEYDLEPVRMVAIDDDWSALRFRKVDYIRSLKRKSSMALSRKGKARSRQNP